MTFEEFKKEMFKENVDERIAYGDPILKKRASEISKETPRLKETIANMYESMYGAHGVGLAAPQVGLSIRLFLVDTSPFAEDEDLSDEDRATLKNFNRVFINAKILEEDGEDLILPLNDEILESTGWKTGDELLWETKAENVWTLRKKP